MTTTIIMTTGATGMTKSIRTDTVTVIATGGATTDQPPSACCLGMRAS
jgi:hypothetical protein